MSSVGEGIGKSIGPLLIVGGLVAGAYLFRNEIAGWIRGLLPGKDDVDRAIEDTLGVAPGSITGENGKSKDQICREQHGDNFIWDPWRGVCVNGWTGETPSGPIDTTVPGTTPGKISDAVNPSGNPVQTITITPENMCDWEPWKSSTLCKSSREPIITPGYEEALAGASNLVTGSAAEAYANAQAIRAAAAARGRSGWTYANVYPLIESDGYTELPLSPVLALGINRYGWDVHYTQDSGPWHEGQIISMNSGGSNPFAGKAFDSRMKQAMAYGGV